MSKLQKDRKRLNLILYISSVIFFSISTYELGGLWDFKHINEPFVKGLVCFGLAIMCLYMPYSFSRCKDCNEQQKEMSG